MLRIASTSRARNLYFQDFNFSRNLMGSSNALTQTRNLRRL